MAGSVFRTPAADDWLALLEGLDQPHRSGRVRAAALTCFFGHTTAELDAGGDAVTDGVADRCGAGRCCCAAAGSPPCSRRPRSAACRARVLGSVGGERLLTDLRHLAQVLHERPRERLGLTALLGWFREERRAARRGTERTRRLDSDAAAVQIVTIHGSKGLQYPVVYLPFACRRLRRPTGHAALPRRRAARCLDVARRGRTGRTTTRGTRPRRRGSSATSTSP